MKLSPSPGRQLSFEAKLENWFEGMDYCAVSVPAKITQALGTQGPVLVMARVNQSEPFKVSLVPIGGGQHFIRIKAKVRKETKIKTGDRVRVRITVLDRADVTYPKDLLSALRAERITEAFKSLPPGEQNFILRRIDDAAKPETRKKRIQDAIAATHRRREKLSDQQKGLPIMSFETSKQWEKWLAKNHTISSGIWLSLKKKNSDQPSVTYAEALDAALCYGWIDGQRKSSDDRSYLQKFTRRRSKSIWSKKNTEHVNRLTKAGKMKPAGLAAVDEAKKDGRWKSAYDSQSNSKIPEDFLKELSRNKKAQAFFSSLNRANLYAIAYRLQTARKPETREKRMKEILKMMANGKKFHP